MNQEALWYKGRCGRKPAGLPLFLPLPNHIPNVNDVTYTSKISWIQLSNAKQL